MNDRAHAVHGFGSQHPDWRPFGAALAVGVVYYAGAKIGLALTFAPYPISVLWPPNALLLAALLVAPPRSWWLLVLGAFPAHLLAELQGGVPAAMVLCWYVSNVSEALLGALFVRYFAGSLDGLDRLRTTLVFFGATIFAPLVSSFLDAGFVRLVGWGEVDYWTLWQARFFTNMLAILTFVPVVVTWAKAGPVELRRADRAQLIEASTLLAGLLTVSIVTFDSGVAEPEASSSLLYLPMPFLLWAALRFGPRLTSASFAIVAFLVIWGAAHGRGPFLGAATHENALPIQLFLISIAVPLLFLAAVIEERRQAAVKLSSSEALFSTAFRSSPYAMAISRLEDGKIVDVNDRWLELFGYEPAQRTLGTIAPLAAHARAGNEHQLKALEDAATMANGGVHDLELSLTRCSGALRQALVSVDAIDLDGEPGLLTTVRDVTEQRRSEHEAREQQQQLTHLTRVASLADFSGALAHELNQPLTAILSNAQAAQRFLAREPPDVLEIRSILTEIAESDKRAGVVISKLRLLMKKGEPDFVPVELNTLVNEVLQFVRGEFATLDVDVHATLAPDLPRVRGDRVQLQQLLLNLISNACDAMHACEGGSKRLDIMTVHGGDGRPQIVVSDTGPGLAADDLERIFEPFFTTKESGLGLGLPICRSIAAAHGGTLHAEHHHGGGASFRLVLPAA
jgi:two-component system sensor kinase FixL